SPTACLSYGPVSPTACLSYRSVSPTALSLLRPVSPAPSFLLRVLPVFLLCFFCGYTFRAMRTHALVPVLALSAAVILPGALVRTQEAPPTPSLTDEQMEHFLKTARVTQSRTIGKGVTNSLRATLTDGTLTHDAHIQTVDEKRSTFQGR